MALNPSAVATQLQTLISGLAGFTGVGVVQIGQPESPVNKLGAYIAMGALPTVRHTTGSARLTGHLWVSFYRRLDGAEGTAETDLMGVVAAFIQAVLDDLSLAGTCKTVDLDTSRADDPEYSLMSGKEIREYPIVLTFIQDTTYATNP